MIKTIKIEYEEQSKAVVAKTKIEVELTTEEEIQKYTPEIILKESNDLFNKASEFSENKTKRKALQ